MTINPKHTVCGMQRHATRLAACLVVLVSCLPFSRVHAAAGEPFISAIQLDSLTYRNGILAWKTDCGAGTTFASSRIQLRPSGGGSTTTLYFPSGCPSTRVFSQTVALDEEFEVFWASGAGEILHLPSGATTASTPNRLAAMETPGAYPPSVSAGDSFVFWTETLGEFLEQGKIFRVPKTGGTRELVLDLTPQGGGAVGVEALTDNEIVFLLSNGELFYATRVFVPFPAPGYYFWSEQEISDRATAFTLVGDRIYFAARAATGASVEIRSASVDEPRTSTLHHTVSGAGSPFITDIAADAEAVYWHEVRSSTGPLMRKRFSEAAAVPITDPIPGAALIYLKSDGRHLFWKDGNSTVRRLAVNAAAVTWDLAATGLEVIQVIQNPANTVRSVAGKPTFVRLYGQLISSSSGASEVRAWPMALLHGTGPDGSPLPGSPLTPMGDGAPDALFDRPHDRTVLAEGFLFRLPREWTMAGEITLRGDINPSGVIHETDLSNNTTNLTRLFLLKSPICVVVHPLRSNQGTTGSYSPELQPYFDLAEVLLPTSDLHLHWPGGSPFEEYEFPFSSGPYELSNADDDTAWVMVKLYLRSIFGDDPDACEPTGAKTHRASFFLPFADQVLNGLAGPNDTLISVLDLTGRGINNPLGGITFAHELGHNYDRQHVDCAPGDPDDPDPIYPWGCNISSGPTAHLGFNPLTRTIILDTDAGDLMSYAHRMGRPRWTSDYTWRNIANQIATRTASASELNMFGATIHIVDAPVAPQALVLGQVLADGRADMLPATALIDPPAVARATEAYANPGDALTYQLRAFDGAGVLIRSVPVKAFKAHDGSGLLLMALMPDDPAVARVELVRTAAPGAPLATLRGGGGDPLVEISRPNANEVVADTLVVHWSGKDPEGEILRYTIRYSNNDGKSWHVLQEDTPATELAISTAGIPGGAQCRIQVLASDGLRTGSAVSPIFSLKAKAPNAYISFETPRGMLYNLNQITISPSEELILHGEAFDDEDSLLDDSSLAWTVTGPVLLSATGKEFRLSSLPPGTYNVALRAFDTSNMTGDATAKVTIEPKFIAQVAIPPIVDGYPDDPVYFADHDPIKLRYVTGELGMVRMVHGPDGLYICLSGMPVGSNPQEWVGIVLDPDHSGDPSPQTKDLRLIVFADGRMARQRGNGSSFTPDTVPLGFRARVARNGATWNAEFRIDDATLGGWSGQMIGMDIAHYHRRSSGDDTHWLAGAGWNVPVTWADVVLGPNPADSFDGDGDGMADQWEITHFQSLQRNGSGSADQDAHTDLAEYQAGTNPLNGKSFLNLQSVERTGGKVRLSWQGVEGRVYTVWESRDLSAFMPTRTGILGAHGLQTIELPLGQGPAFFRIQATLAR